MQSGEVLLQFATISAKNVGTMLSKYKHKLVIANILQTRKHRVVFVTPTTSYEVHLSREQALQGLEIEEPIVADVVQKHGEFINSCMSRQ
ncbi:hypothetical protein CVS40_12468 [Lucilia cuprina]|nr:hypothetical protein CVS40_12468 [Lucilia cuprina]